MTVTWNDLPVEMQKLVVAQMAPFTRTNLSMCSKEDNELVRSTRQGRIAGVRLASNHFHIDFEPNDIIRSKGLEVRRRNDGGSEVWNNFGIILNCSNNNDWKKTILKIMSVIGTTFSFHILELRPIDNEFEELFNWFRSKIDLNPRIVDLDFERVENHYDRTIEPLLDWPEETRIHLTVLKYRLPILERFDAYHKIYEFHLTVDKVEEDNINMTDEKLGKLTNVKEVTLHRSHVTVNGFNEFVKRWISRQNDCDDYRFDIWFRYGYNCKLNDIEKEFQGIIESSQTKTTSGSECWETIIRKNEDQIGCVEFDGGYSIEFKSMKSTK